MYPDDIARAVLFHPSGKPSAAFFHFSVDCAEILFCYFAASYFFIYPPQSFRCLCRNYYSAGVAVDSVAKCRRKAPLLFRAVFAAPPEISLYMVYQRSPFVRLRSAGAACISAVNSHSRLLVNKKKFRIFVKD